MQKAAAPATMESFRPSRCTTAAATGGQEVATAPTENMAVTTPCVASLKGRPSLTSIAKATISSTPDM